MRLLQERAVEIESHRGLLPESVTDWMALALFAENRQKFTLMCANAEKKNNLAYRQAAMWLNRLMERNESIAG
jgi:hypothetical protein